MFWDAIMPRTTQHKRTRQSIDAQFALSERVLKGIHKSIEADIERARDLQIEHDLALHRAGKNPLCDGDESIREARRRVG